MATLEKLLGNCFEPINNPISATSIRRKIREKLLWQGTDDLAKEAWTNH